MDSFTVAHLFLHPEFWMLYRQLLSDGQRLRIADLAPVKATDKGGLAIDIQRFGEAEMCITRTD